jgi:hypothetical protein
MTWKNPVAASSSLSPLSDSSHITFFTLAKEYLYYGQFFL